MKFALIVALLYCNSALATITTLQTDPLCVTNINELPIFPVEVASLHGEGDDRLLTIELGTTFLVGQDIWITAAHVIGDHFIDISIYGSPGYKINMELLLLDDEADIAVLYAPSGTQTPISIKNTFDIDEYAYSVGFPAYGGNTMVSFIGYITGTTEDGFALDSFVSGGMSGGPAIQCTDNGVAAVGMLLANYINIETRTFTIDGQTYSTDVSANAGGGVFLAELQTYIDLATSQ